MLKANAVLPSGLTGFRPISRQGGAAIPLSPEGDSPLAEFLWEGDTLLMETKGAFGDNAYTMKDKWSLSEDRKVLTILRHFSSGMGELDQKLVFEKQP
jgi:hypothetical protein